MTLPWSLPSRSEQLKLNPMLSMKSLSRDFVDAIRQTHGNELKKIKLSNNGLQCIKNIEYLSPVLEKLDLSCNDLNDIHPLSLLSSLVELDLSGNRIDDLTSLSCLTNLKCLRLQGNCITRLQTLEPLRNATALRELTLQGNPICVADNSHDNNVDCSTDAASCTFPFNVFRLLPQLDILDQWHRPTQTRQRQQSMTVWGTPDRTLPHNMNRVMQSPYSIPPTANEDELAALRSRVKVLEVQLEAAETSFALQEATLGSLAVQSTTTPSLPYRKMLELWRKKALQHNVARLHTERTLSHTMTELKTIRSELRTSLSGHAAELLGLQESLDAQSATVGELSMQLRHAQESLVQETNWRTQLEKRARTDSHAFAAMKLALIHHRDLTNSSVLEAQVKYAQALQCLNLLTERVTSATARVQFATGMVAQKEVHLRNDAAAVEAERRLLRRSRDNDVATSSNSSSSSGGYPSDKMLSQVSLHPDTEALLRTFFLSLDQEDSGSVEVAVLLRCFSTETEPVPVIASSDTVATASATERDGSDDVAALGRVIREAVGGDGMLQRVVDGLTKAVEHGPSSVITWGEFLLLTIPSSVSPQAALATSELAALQRKRLLLDSEWGVVPLDWKYLCRRGENIAEPTTTQLSSGSSYRDIPASSSSSSSSFLRHEIHRLATERSLLQARLQAMSRTLERRAEGIKSFFESELQMARVRENRLTSDNAALRSQLEQVETRASESEAAFRNRVAALSERVDAFEQENKDLSLALSSRKSEESLRLEQAWQAEKDKLHRLEIEHNLLQREASKRDIRCRGLQRDVMRLQAALSAREVERQALQLVVTEKEEAKEAEVAALVQSVADEREKERLAQPEVVTVSPPIALPTPAQPPTPILPPPPPPPSPPRPVQSNVAPVPALLPLSAQFSSSSSSSSSSGSQQAASDIYSTQLSRLLRLAGKTAYPPKEKPPTLPTKNCHYLTSPFTPR